jgi:hypothetical protein
MAAPACRLSCRCCTEQSGRHPCSVDRRSVKEPCALEALAVAGARAGGGSVQRVLVRFYILRRFTTGRLTDETHWLPNKDMTKLSEVSDETSTKLFPHFQCQTLQCGPSTLKPRPGGSGPVA